MGNPSGGRRTSRPPQSPPPSSKGPRRDPYRDVPEDEYTDEERYERYSNDAPAPRARGGFSLSWQDMLFVGLLLLAAIRGARNKDGDGCLPGKGCQRVLTLGVVSTVLLGGAIYLSSIDQNTVSDQVIGGMACIGTLLCFGSLGTMLFVFFGVIRLINLDLTPDNAMDQAGGIFGNIFGGLFGDGK